MINTVFHKIVRHIRHWIGEHILYGRFPYAYAHYYYWKYLRKELNYRNPKDINEKLFWLARYWQDPRIVQCADKLAVREYIKSLGLEYILNEIYCIYEKAEEINIDTLPDKFVIKTNHCGGGSYMVICDDKSQINQDQAIDIINEGLNHVIGISTCEYQYQYIKPRAFAEKFIEDKNGERLEIQFFCFNGVAKHILVRNDLGKANAQPCAISYDMDWNRVRDRVHEDMSINISRPTRLNEMIAIANQLAAPFPHVRIDLYYVDEQIIFGEMTFSSSGNILWKYPQLIHDKWGEELILPNKLSIRWKDVFTSYYNK